MANTKINLEIKYPILGKSISSPHIAVLFIGESSGFVVETQSVDYEIGDFKKSWDMDSFIFDETVTVTLSNKLIGFISLDIK